MMPWLRAPREVYRVYGEDEYLEGEDGSASEQPRVSAGDSIEEDSHVALASATSRGSRQGRLIGLGLLVGVTVGAVGLLVVNMSHRSPPRGLGSSRSTPARAFSPTLPARPGSGAGHSGRESEAKPSARKRSRGHRSISRAMRRLVSRGSEKSTQVRTSIAPSLPSSGQVSISQPEAPSADDEFDFEH